MGKTGRRTVLFSSVSQSCRTVTPWTAALQASLSIVNSRSLLKLMSIELVMPSNHLILCPLLLLPSIFPSIRVFSKESVLCIRWPKYWSFSFSISLSNECSGLISHMIIPCSPGTLKRLLQYHNSKATILQCSAVFIVQVSHPYMTTGEGQVLYKLGKWETIGSFWMGEEVWIKDFSGGIFFTKYNSVFCELYLEPGVLFFF